MVNMKFVLAFVLAAVPAAGYSAQFEESAVEALRQLQDGEAAPAPEMEDARAVLPEAQSDMEELWRVSPEACRKYAANLRDGDIIFQEGRFMVFKRIAEATNSWVSHVGVAFKEGGEWIVYESKVTPGSRTPLCRFLGRSGKGHTAIGRLRRERSGRDVERLRAWASDPANRGVPYDLGFDYNRKGSSFCSKFVSQAYASIGKPLGRTQTLRQLVDEFRGTPERKRSLVRFFKLLFVRVQLPWERVTLTPASVMRDGNLDVREAFVEGAPAG